MAVKPRRPTQQGQLLHTPALPVLATGCPAGQATVPDPPRHSESDSASDRLGLLSGKAVAQIFIVCVWLSHGICNLPVTSVYLGKNSREILA